MIKWFPLSPFSRPVTLPLLLRVVCLKRVSYPSTKRGRKKGEITECQRQRPSVSSPERLEKGEKKKSPLDVSPFFVPSSAIVLALGELRASLALALSLRSLHRPNLDFPRGGNKVRRVISGCVFVALLGKVESEREPSLMARAELGGGKREGSL